VDVDLADTAAPIALITMKKRRASGPQRFFQQASLEVGKAFVEC
jgi:hypothetical protein